MKIRFRSVALVDVPLVELVHCPGVFAMFTAGSASSFIACESRATELCTGRATRMSYKPAGYSSVSPYLIVRDAEKTLAFIAAVFDAERLRVIPREDGEGIVHAEARIDYTVIMMGEMPGGPDANVHVYVANVEAAFARAKQAGGTVVQALERKGDGDCRGDIADGNGTMWWLSRQD